MTRKFKSKFRPAVNLGEEVCRCGHLRKNHDGLANHGMCTELIPSDAPIPVIPIPGWISCTCGQFTWFREPEGGYKFDP